MEVSTAAIKILDPRPVIRSKLHQSSPKDLSLPSGDTRRGHQEAILWLQPLWTSEQKLMPIVPCLIPDPPIMRNNTKIAALSANFWSSCMQQ